jgi:single-strand DNA-binding protein
LISAIQVIVGNLTHDPELRRTQAGKPVVNFTIASTPRVRNPQTKEWEDGEAHFQKCTAWDDYADAIADSLHKGDKVVAVGTLKPNSWTDKDSGTKRTDVVLQIDEIGVSPRHVVIQTTKRQRGGQRADSNQGQDGWANQGPVSDDTPF